MPKAMPSVWKLMLASMSGVTRIVDRSPNSPATSTNATPAMVSW